MSCEHLPIILVFLIIQIKWMCEGFDLNLLLLLLLFHDFKAATHDNFMEQITT